VVKPEPLTADGASTPPASGDHPLVDASALKTHLGRYRSGGAETLVDPEWLRQARRRRRDLGETMRAFDFDTAQQRLPAADDSFISRKIDGEFTCLVYRDGACLSLNPGGTVRIGAPFHDEAARLLQQAGVRSALLGGELYVRRSDGQRPRVHDVTRVARNPASQAEVDSLCFAVFNVYELDGRDPSLRYGDALEAAQRLLAAGDRVHVVETVHGDRQRVFQQYRQWVEQEGAEGVVTRSDSTGIFKIKPRHSLDLAVVGFSEGIDDRTGLLHSLLVAIPTDADSFQIVGRVGGGFSDELRASLLTLLNGRVVTSDYVEVNSDQVGYRMVEPGLVAELSCLDVVSRTSLGSTIDRMVLDWHSSERRWEGVRRLPLCSLISPQFVRLRDDKQARPEDLRLSQLSDITEIPELERNAAELRLPASTVLERAVATKVLKGATLVRKLLLWKTNKETVSPDHPAYVLHLTDYSPNREAPLNHEIRVSSSEEQIRQFFLEWKAKAFVGGWKEVGKEVG
jgi:ATP dependent DNA ligase C terminal region